MGKSIFSIVMEGRGLQYNFSSAPMQTAVNKIFGESYGLDHHKDSMRIGWNFDPMINLFNIYLYGYEEGVRTVEHLGDLPVNAFDDLCFYIYIYKTKRNVYVELRERPELSTDKGATLYSENIAGRNWMLKPYFGGTIKAKGDYITKIEKVL